MRLHCCVLFYQTSASFRPSSLAFTSQPSHTLDEDDFDDEDFDEEEYGHMTGKRNLT